MTLTPRQLEIVRMVAQGKSYKAIARATGTSHRTVINHVQDAAKRINGDGPSARPRDRVTIWFLSIKDDAA